MVAELSRSYSRGLNKQKALCGFLRASNSFRDRGRLLTALERQKGHSVLSRGYLGLCEPFLARSWREPN